MRQLFIISENHVEFHGTPYLWWEWDQFLSIPVTVCLEHLADLTAEGGNKVVPANDVHLPTSD